MNYCASVACDDLRTNKPDHEFHGDYFLPQNIEPKTIQTVISSSIKPK